MIFVSGRMLPTCNVDQALYQLLKAYLTPWDIREILSVLPHIPKKTSPKGVHINDIKFYYSKDMQEYPLCIRDNNIV